MLLGNMCRFERARECLDEFRSVEEEGKLALLLGKGTVGICNRVMGECERA